MARVIRKLKLGKHKTICTYCSEEIEYNVEGQKGVYYEVDLKPPKSLEIGDRPIQITSDHPIKVGQEVEVNLIVESSTALKIKARKEKK
jgi:hypothetical protein